MDEQAIKELSMPHLQPFGLDMEDVTPYLGHFTMIANDKYYLQNLRTNEDDVAARNLIIEILIHADKNQFKKNMLAREVAQGLRVQNIESVEESRIQELIDSICVMRDRSNYVLK